jgi:hypothetical protein
MDMRLSEASAKMARTARAAALKIARNAGGITVSDWKRVCITRSLPFYKSGPEISPARYR